MKRKKAAEAAGAGIGAGVALRTADTGRMASTTGTKHDDSSSIIVEIESGASSATGSGSGSGPGSHGAPSTSASSSHEPDNNPVVPSAFPPGARLATAFPTRGALAERDAAGGASPYGYFSSTAPGLGLGLPERARLASTSSSTLATSEAGASQGSEEVLGRMELDG